MLIVPHVAPEHPAPVTLHVIVVFVVPVTVAWNCSDVLTAMIVTFGETVTMTGTITVTAAEAETVVSATEVAVTVTLAGFGTLAGATYRPF